MGWKFWEKKSAGGNEAATKPIKLPKPQDLPPEVGRYLVVELGMEPDRVWRLKSTVRRRAEDRDSFDVRVFDAGRAQAGGVFVKDFNSFNEHPELVLFEGWYKRGTSFAQLVRK